MPIQLCVELQSPTDFRLGFRSVADAPLAPADVRIETAYAAVNRLDAHVCQGLVPELRGLKPPLALGSECAGRVLETGSAVSTIAAGDWVAAVRPNTSLGCLADEVVVSATLATRLTNPATAATSSASLQAGIAAQAVLEQLRGSSRTLVIGGTTTVGAILIQVAALAGVEVVAVARSSYSDALLRLGASAVVAYDLDDYTTSRFDTVVDLVGGDEFRHALRATAKGGRTISLGGPVDARFAKRYGLSRLSKTLVRVQSRELRSLEKQHGVEYNRLLPQIEPRVVEAVADSLNRGDFRTPIDRVFHQADAADAVRYTASRRAKGKVLVDYLNDPSHPSSNGEEWFALRPSDSWPA